MANIFRTAILKLSSQVVTATGNNLYVNGNEVSLSSDLTQTGSNLDNRISNWGVKSLVVSGTNYSGNINVTGLGSVTVDTNGNIIRISGVVVDTSTFVTAAQSGQFADKNALGLTGSNLDNRINNWGVKSIQISGSNYSGNVLMTGLGSVTLDTNGNMVRISGVVVDSSSFVTASQSGQFADKNSLSQTGSILGTRIDNWGVREIKITGQSFSGNLLLTGINNAVIDIQGGNLIRVNVETGYLAGYATTSSLASTGQQNYTNLNANAINLSGALANSGSVLYLASNPQNYSSSGNVLNTGQALYNLVTSLSGKLDSSGTNLQNQINSITSNTGLFYLNSNPSGFITNISGIVPSEIVYIYNNQNIGGNKLFSGNFTLYNKYPSGQNFTGVSGLVFRTGISGLFYLQDTGNQISVDIYNRILSGQWNAQFPPKVSGQFLVTGNQTTINSLAGGAGEANTASNIGGGIGLFSGKQSVDLKFYSILGGTGINISLSGQQVSINSTANTGWESKSITVENPVPGDNITMFYTSNSISVKKITSIVRGGTTASGLFSIRFDPNRTLGTDLLNNGFSATGITTGNMFTSFTVPTITGNNFVWLFMNATGGNLSGLHTSLFYTNL